MTKSNNTQENSLLSDTEVDDLVEEMLHPKPNSRVDSQAFRLSSRPLDMGSPLGQVVSKMFRTIH